MDPDVPGEFRREQIVEVLRQKRAVTVTGLARVLGVARMTVRRDLDVLERRGLLSRVHGGAVTPVNVRPSLRSGQGRTVAMIVPDISYHWPVVTAAAQIEASSRQLRVIVRLSHDYGRDTIAQVQRLVRASRIDGLILAPFIRGPERDELEKWLSLNPLPAVYVERTPVDPRLSWIQSVGVDNRVGGAIAAQYLAELGHQRMVMMVDQSAPGALERIAGWNAAVESLGLQGFDILDSVKLTDPHREPLLAEVLARLSDAGVTAVFANGDPHALALLQTCHDHGIRVPDELSILGFDDELANLGSPTLSSVRTPKDTVGRMAVRLLLNSLTPGDEPMTQRVSLAPRVIARESTASPRA